MKTREAVIVLITISCKIREDNDRFSFNSVSGIILQKLDNWHFVPRISSVLGSGSGQVCLSRASVLDAPEVYARELVLQWYLARLTKFDWCTSMIKGSSLDSEAFTAALNYK